MSSYQVDRRKWSKMTIFQQMANIGAEVGRTFNAIRQGDHQRAERAMIRALDLFDATVENYSFARNKEILRSKEQFLEAYCAKQPDAGLEKYFTQFAYVGR